MNHRSLPATGAALRLRLGLSFGLSFGLTFGLTFGLPLALMACGHKDDSGAAAGKASADADAASQLVRQAGRIRIAEQSPLRSALKIEPAREESIERPMRVPGVVEADPSRTVKVVPPVSGRILKLDKFLGDSVKAGEPLFTLDSADLAQAFSDASKAQAGLNLARKNVERQRELARAEIAAGKDVEQAENDFSQARTEADRAQVRLSQLGVSLSSKSDRQYTLRSPISGQVIELNGAQGAFWNDTNAAILTVADLSTVWMAASVQEKDLAAISVGQPARITLNAYPAETFDGKVRFVGSVLDPDTRTVKVRIAIDNGSGRFRPGMFARVVFSGPAHTSVVVPTDALVQSGFNTRVFVEVAPWEFESRVVKSGTQFGDRAEIVSGLKAGERIVVKEGVLLND